MAELRSLFTVEMIVKQYKNVSAGYVFESRYVLIEEDIYFYDE